MKTLHVISHTHWDREWYLTFQQFRLKLVHLIDKLLEILEKDPEFKHFMLDGQTIVLDDYLQVRPENEEKLRQYIQEGRILIGPWHILPDMFLVSPEAHIRNLLEGSRTASKFGLKMPIGYAPDSFGHPGQMPQILASFGIKTASLWRGLSDQPVELWWESPDGSRVFLAYLRDSYSNGADLPVSNPEVFTQLIAKAGASLADHSIAEDHLIMLGTDHMEPSPHTSQAIAFADAQLSDTRVLHSTLPEYIQAVSHHMDKLDVSIPTVRGEFRACSRSHLLPNVLSTRMWIKQQNQHSQTLLEKWAEPFSVFAEYLLPSKLAQNHLANRTSQTIQLAHVAPIIRHAWRLLMENHPHDSICGCSIDQVHDEMKPRFYQADQIGEEITRQSLDAISLTVNTQSTSAFSAIVIFNPHGFTRRDLVELDVNTPLTVPAFELIHGEGTVIPHEYLGVSNEELANFLLTKDTLRDTLGTINDGWVNKYAITAVKVSRQGTTVTIEAILDEKGQPNLAEWEQADAELTKYEHDPSIKHFHLLAHTPQATRIRFTSPEVPPLGWQTVWLHAVDAPKTAPPSVLSPILRPLLPLLMRLAQTDFVQNLIEKLSRGDEAKPPFTIENAFYRVEASTEDGTLRITDKHTGAVYTGLNRFVDGGDAGDEYNYSPPPKDSFYTPDLVSLRVFRHKQIPTLEINYGLKLPAQLSPDRNSRSDKMITLPIQSRISLIPGVPRIDVHTHIENLAEDHRLRVHVPAPFIAHEAAHDGHFEVVHRPIGLPEKGAEWVESPRPEVPQHAFTDVSDGKIGLMVANRGLPEVEALNVDPDGHTEMALTLLRCVGWLSRNDLSQRTDHAGPGLPTPGAQMLGSWSFDYAIIPHKGDWIEAFQQAYAFTAPLRAVQTTLHTGDHPAWGSFITHTPAEFVISAIKETEDGKGWLVRGFNITSQPLQLNLRPYRPFATARRVNLAEEEISVLTVQKDGSIKVPVSGHEVVSVVLIP